MPYALKQKLKEVPYLSFIKITILSSAESGNIIQLKTDIFSRKVLAGCVWMMYHKQSMMKMAIVNCKLNWIKIPIS